MLSVPGGYNEWSEWTPCPKSCGGAMQIRTRNCTSPEPMNGGADCSVVGPNVETKQCNTLPCPGQTGTLGQVRLTLFYLERPNNETIVYQS